MCYLDGEDMSTNRFNSKQKNNIKYSNEKKIKSLKT